MTRPAWAEVDLECISHNVRVLDRQVFVTQKHLDASRDRVRVAIVDGREHPRSLGDGEMRHPGAAGDEGLSGFQLFRIIASQQAHEDIGVNGPHGAP